MKMKNVMRKTRGRAAFFSVLAVAAVLAATTTFAACTAKKPAQGTIPRQKAILRAAYLPTANYLTTLTKTQILQEELAREGAEALFIGPSAPVDAIKIVTSGNADITTTGTGFFINLVNQGNEWVAFALEKYSGDSQGIVAAPNSGIEKLADLYGKKVGIAQRGATADYILSAAFSHAGLDVSRVEKVELAQADFAAVFVSGRIDALASFDQNFANALAVPGAKKLIDGTEYGSLNWSLHIASRAFAEKHPELLRATYRALRREAARAREEPSLIMDAYRQFGASETQIAILKNFNVPQILPLDAQAVADFARQADQYVEFGFINAAPRDFSSHVLDFSRED
jgi:sulfonate transport system substrate-binding protein